MDSFLFILYRKEKEVMIKMNKSIKTKDTVKDIKTVDRNQQLHHFVKKANIRNKDKQSNHSEESHNNYATNQVVKQEKKTAIQTYQKAKQQYVKSKSKKIKNKKDEELNTKTKINHIEEKNNIVHFKQAENIKKKDKLSIKSIGKNKFNDVSRNYNQSNPQHQMKALHMKKHQQKVADAKHNVNVLKRGESNVKSGITKSYQAVRKTGKGIQFLISAGTGFLLIATLALFFGVFGALAGDSGTNSAIEPLSGEVLSYTTTIEKYAKQYEISEYVPLIQAVMMQESGGKGTDPMQSSECIYNTKYDKRPNGIKESEYSIDCGVHYLADCLKQAKVSDPYDMSHISLALQGYNFGNEYIDWAVEHFDWESDNDPDHVGIVEKVEGGKVYTIEGNSSDEVKAKSYSMDYKCIFGYGLNTILSF